MIELVRGNIFDSRREALVNPVNCYGAMGAGLALQFKNKFPENYEAYSLKCFEWEIHPGCVFVFSYRSQLIFNFPTKVHAYEPSRLEYIRWGLVSLVQEARKWDIRSLAIPPIGCGLGGLDWRVVKPIIMDKLNEELPSVRILLYENGQ